MIPRIKNFSMPCGNDVDIPIHIRYRDGTPYDLTGCRLIFVAKINGADREPLFKLTTENGGIAVLEGNIVKVTITRSLTASIASEIAEYNLHIITADNKFKTPLQGAIKFMPIIE